jgi:hypothetical protein
MELALTGGALVALGSARTALAHGVEEADAAFIQGIQGIAVPEFLYLGALRRRPRARLPAAARAALKKGIGLRRKAAIYAE